MGIMKKAAALTAAAALTLGIMSVEAFAEDTYAIYLKSDSASVGDTVSLSVIVDTAEEVGGLSFLLNYNPEELELQSDTLKVGDAVLDWLAGDENDFALKDGSIGFARLAVRNGFSEPNTEIMSVSFKVLKPNGAVTLSDVVINANDRDSTDITAKYPVFNTIINCSHKNSETETVPSTCTVKGSETTVCKDCGEAVDTKELPLADHTLDEGVVTKDPTCTEEGEKTFTCSVCGETTTEAVEVLGHRWDDGTITKQPTCTEEGERLSTCENCGEETKVAIPAAGHAYGAWTKGDREGTEKRVCEVCQDVETRTAPNNSGNNNNPPADGKPSDTGANTENNTEPADSAPSNSSAETGAPSSGSDKPANSGGNANTGVGGITAAAAITAITAAAVIVAKKRK